MRPLTDREKRTLRIGGMGLGIYLVLFFGIQAWRYLERQRSEYRRLVRDASNLKQKLVVYEDKAQSARQLMEHFRLDPGQLSRTSLVAQASAAIQQSALAGGIGLGPIRETASGASGQQLSAMQLEGVGPVPAILQFLQGLESLGFPLIADSVQLTPDPSQPGQLKLNVSIVILDFDQWKSNEGKPNA